MIFIPEKQQALFKEVNHYDDYCEYYETRPRCLTGDNLSRRGINEPGLDKDLTGT